MRKVFVSSTSDELRKTRQAVCDAIMELGDFVPVTMDTWGAQPTPPINTCLAMLRTADVFVGLIGMDYGSSPPEGEPSYTEREYNEARRLKLPCLMFVAPKPRGYAAIDQRQQDFRSRVLTETAAKVTSLRTPDRVARHVVTALTKLRRPIIKPLPMLFGGVVVAAIFGVLTSLLLSRVSLVAEALSAFIVTVVALGMSALFVQYHYYQGVLTAGSAPLGSGERAKYDSLRLSLVHRGVGGETGFSRRLRRFLDAVDRFFNDANLAGPAWLARLVHLQTEAPLLTAPALNRCLLLSWIYPMLVILMVWALSGQVGPAEAAMHLPRQADWWQRSMICMFGLLAVASIWNARRETSRVRILGRFVLFGEAVACAMIGAGTGVAIGTGTGVGAVALAIAVVFPNAVAGAFTGAGICGIVTAYSFAGSHANSFDVALDIAVAISAAFAAGAAVFWTSEIARRRGWQGCYLAVFLVLMFIAPIIQAAQFATQPGWSDAGPMLLIFGLLTVVNAPFDWLALGITRALLRRGVELGLLWPYPLALLDAAIATIIIFVLALAMVLTIQFFDTLAVLHGGVPILPIRDVLSGIRANPGNPAFWWVYATLFSTMIPSVINLAIGGLSLLRGIPPLARRLLCSMPKDGEVLPLDRIWIPPVLTLQVALGAVLGIVVQALLVFGIIGLLLPAVGWNLLDLADALVRRELPHALIIKLQWYPTIVPCDSPTLPADLGENRSGCGGYF